MKSQISFPIKVSIVIISIIAFMLVIYYYTSFTSKIKEEKAKIEFRAKVLNVLQKLVSSEGCLAYSGFVKSSKPVLDVKKIEDFVARYKDIEPDCAKALDFDYSVEIIQLPKEIRTYIGERRGKSKTSDIAAEILNIIDEEKTIFVLDVSGSMSYVGGECEIDTQFPNTKICCLKMFMEYFLENLSPETPIGVNVYGIGACGNKWLKKPYEEIKDVREELKEKIMNLRPIDGTPIGSALNEAYKYVENGYIVLLTDGHETCGLNPKKVVEANKHKAKIITIGFGSGANMNLLKKISKETGGKSFFASTCEELISKKIEKPIIEFSIEKRTWRFSNLTFSPEKARWDEIEISYPVTIRYNETTSVEGMIKIKAVRGELEKFVSILEDVCKKAENGKDVYFADKFYFSYTVKKDGNKICMLDKCKVFSCSIPLQMDEIGKGEYYLKVIYDKAKGEIGVIG